MRHPLIVGIWVRMKVQGRDNLAGLDTPALYIFNHSDDFDGPVLVSGAPASGSPTIGRCGGGRCHADTQGARLHHPILLCRLQPFPLEPFMPSLEYVGTLVDQGWNVVLSPEGRLSTSGELHPFKSGVGLLAVNLGVPVVPVKTIGLFGRCPCMPGGRNAIVMSQFV